MTTRRRILLRTLTICLLCLATAGGEPALAETASPDSIGSGETVAMNSSAAAGSEVTATAPTITSVTSVVHGNTFYAHITGEPGKLYYLYVKDEGLPSVDQYPLIAPGQPYVAPGTSVPVGEAANFTHTKAHVAVDGYGNRWIQFNTTPFTRAQSFTFGVVDPLNLLSIRHGRGGRLTMGTMLSDRIRNRCLLRRRRDHTLWRQYRQRDHLPLPDRPEPPGQRCQAR